MGRDPRIDTYIAGKPDFARPILEHLREAVHAACPEVEESIKWGMPAFMVDGRPLANMAAFKAHATFGFWNRDAMSESREGAMGQFGRITSLADLPDDARLAEAISQAALLAAQGVKRRQPKPVAKLAAELPEDLSAALEAQAGALANFHAFPPSAQREYVDWVVGAKRPETRASRVAQAAEWIKEGKRRYWKYEGC
jgi:uncharacterized protein YdeI (YjbR/CyaY-like superfamily)